jgi:uncharacterized protein (UPF0212 family)
MKHTFASRVLALLALSTPAAAAAQEPARPAPTPSPAAQSGLAVSIPAFPNSACPIMGKRVSTRLFAETERGRIYVCCKSCIQDILLNVDGTYRTAYPSAREAGNQICPVSNEPVGEQPFLLELQGVRFALSRAEHADAARANAQALLARHANPSLEELGNRTCPVTGKPADAAALVQIGTTLVRLASLREFDAVRADPARVLAKARALREQELKSAAAERKE